MSGRFSAATKSWSARFVGYKVEEWDAPNRSLIHSIASLKNGGHPTSIVSIRAVSCVWVNMIDTAPVDRACPWVLMWSMPTANPKKSKHNNTVYNIQNESFGQLRQRDLNAKYPGSHAAHQCPE